MADRGLTEKQIRFCQEYLKLDCTRQGQAYINAGYKGKLPHADVAASKLLKNHKIQAYLSELRSQTEQQVIVTQARVLEELGRLAFSDITEALSFSGDHVTLKNSKELPKRVTSAIESVSAVTTTRGEDSSTKVSLKLHSKVAALTKLADYFGIGTDLNMAIAALRRYGLSLEPDSTSELGWALRPVVRDSGHSATEADKAASEFFSQN